MIKAAFRSIVFGTAFLGFITTTFPAGRELGSFDGLIAAAEGVVAVEILSADYSATPADGPLVAEAKVLKVLESLGIILEEA